MAINETGAAANGSAILDVYSTTRGILIPRTTSASLTPIAGLIYYDNGQNKLVIMMEVHGKQYAKHLSEQQQEQVL